MTLMTWNMRDMNKPFKQKEVLGVLKKYNVQLAGLLETRVKERNAPKCLNKIAKGYNSVNNYNEAINGRIWIIWKPSDYDVQIIMTQ